MILYKEVKYTKWQWKYWYTLTCGHYGNFMFNNTSVSYKLILHEFDCPSGNVSFVPLLHWAALKLFWKFRLQLTAKSCKTNDKEYKMINTLYTFSRDSEKAFWKKYLFVFSWLSSFFIDYNLAGQMSLEELKIILYKDM